MHLGKFALALAFSIPLVLPLSDAANGASINLGGVTIKLPKENKEPADNAENSVRHFLPGVPDTGAVEVRFDIAENIGLVLYMLFQEIRGQEDPAHTIPLTSMETGRAIALFCRAEKWTDVARKNRVGLFTKRLGFIDDAYGEAVEINTGISPGPEQGDNNQAKIMPSSEASMEGGTTAGSIVPRDDPRNFKAANFNSYEDGTTSVQVEHSVEGFSRRFNLPLKDELALADILESTMEYASFRLEKRGFDLDKTDQLFK